MLAQLKVKVASLTRMQSVVAGEGEGERAPLLALRGAHSSTVPAARQD